MRRWASSRRLGAGWKLTRADPMLSQPGRLRGHVCADHSLWPAFRPRGASRNVSDGQFQTLCPVKDYRAWNMSEARKKVRPDKEWEKRLEVVNYRPFD